ncbi:hypothetical protein, partial [Mesorhizobium sp.]
RLRKDSSGPAEPPSGATAGAQKQSDAAATADKAAPTAEQPLAGERKTDHSDLNATDATSPEPAMPEGNEAIDTAEAETEAEDQKDLARLDGLAVSGSLLNYAGR